MLFILLINTISVRHLVIDCLALYLIGAEIFLFYWSLVAGHFTVEYDFSSILGYRLLALYVKGKQLKTLLFCFVCVLSDERALITLICLLA